LNNIHCVIYLIDIFICLFLKEGKNTKSFDVLILIGSIFLNEKSPIFQRKMGLFR